MTDTVKSNRTLCYKCEGTGTVFSNKLVIPYGTDEDKIYLQTCPRCDGKGYTENKNKEE